MPLPLNRARDYLNEHYNYVELLTVVNKTFAGATVQEQYKILKTFLDTGSNVDELLTGTGIAIIHSEPPSKTLHGIVIGVWDATNHKLHEAASERDVDRVLVRICKLEELKVEHLKALSKVVGIQGAYKLKKAELVAALHRI